MKITDMNLICLEECLEHLELGDLLRVADSNKRLRKAAEFVFSRNYGQEIIQFQRILPNVQRPLVSNHFSDISDLRFKFQLLRCFGHLIQSLSYAGLDEDQRVFAYINEYCIKSLTKITFLSVESRLEQFKEPFVNVVEVIIQRCHRFKKGWLKTVFPNIRKLAYCEEDGNCVDTVVDHYPRLEHLNIICFFGSCRNKVILDFLHLNPQLKDFWLFGNLDKPFDEDSLRNVIESMKNLEELQLLHSHVRFRNFTGKKIHSKSVKKFNYIGTTEDNGECPFSFDQLESFESWSQPIDDFNEFIGRHPTIKKITIGDPLTSINVEHLINALPLLTEIYLLRVPISFDDVIELVSGLKLLQKFKFTNYDGPNNLDELRARLGGEWQVLDDKSRLILTKIH